MYDFETRLNEFFIHISIVQVGVCFLFTPALCTSVGNVYSTSIKLSIQ